MANAGFEAKVIEQAAEFGEIGAGIQFGPNGFKMLARLGLQHAIDHLAVFPDDLIMMDSVTELEITRIPVGTPFQTRFRHPYDEGTSLPRSSTIRSPATSAPANAR